MVQVLVLAHAVRSLIVGGQCRMFTLYMLVGKLQHCTSHCSENTLTFKSGIHTAAAEL